VSRSLGWRRGPGRAAVVLVWVILLAGVPPAAADLAYVYDALGRLRAVVDPAADTAIYTYDAVGNVLAITRQSSSQVTVIELPLQAAPSACITLQGTGFDPTPSLNTVTFNGVAGTVTAAAATQLTVCLPAGATTGPLVVTTPAGSTTVPSFTVAATPGPPAITGITPTLGDPGTALTVSGTSFEPTTTRDLARLGGNQVPAPVTSASPTSLGVTIPPGATSGWLTVTTPRGTAVSPQDVFIPPPGYLAANVVDTRRLAYGQTVTTPTIPATKLVLLVFDAPVGERMTAYYPGATSESTVYGPAGAVLYGPVFSGNQLSELTPLATAGTYTVLLKAGVTAAMTISLLGNAQDVTGTITPGGAAVPVTTTQVGQNAALTFTGSAGQRVSLHNQSGTLGPPIALRGPDGTTLWSGVVSVGAFVEPITLTAAGTHTIYIDPITTQVGSLTLRLYDVPPDDTGTITPGGPAVTVTTTVPGQRALRTFTGAVGQRVSVKTTNSTISSGTLTLQGPGGTPIASVALPTFLDTQTLTTAGTHTLVVDPNGLYTGSATLTLYNVPADVPGTLGVGPPGTTVTIGTPGQNAQLTFSGTAGRRASVNRTNNTTGDPVDLQLLKPDGTQLALTGLAFLDAVTLPVSGTYTLVVNPTGAGTGNVTVVRYDFVDVTATTTINGSPRTVSLPTPGQNGTVTFSNTVVNRLATVKITSNTISSVTVRLKKPDGTVMTSLTSGAASFNLAQQTLPVTGTYTIDVDPQGTPTGSLKVQVTSP
jgi:YD repeat-containing protein